MTRKSIFLTAAACALVAMQLPAVAQIDNKPFSFGSATDGGLGMSTAGQQAIIDEKISGSRPRNLVRNTDGTLLDISPGPGHSAIASVPGTGVFVPGFHGSSYKAGDPMMSVGAFNTYFIPRAGAGNGGGYYMQGNSSALVNTWTGRVISGGMSPSYDANSPVDAWTGQVSVMGELY